MSDELRYREALERILCGCRVLKTADTHSIAYEALYPVPQVKEVEVKAWQCPTCDRLIKYAEDLPPSACCHQANNNGKLVLLKGSYSRPIPAKVKRREEIDYYSEYTGMYNVATPAGVDNKKCPPGAKVYMEWTETP